MLNTNISIKGTDFVLEKESVFGKIYFNRKTEQRAILKSFPQDRFTKSNIDDANKRLSKHPVSHKILEVAINHHRVDIFYQYENGMLSLRKFYNILTSIDMYGKEQPDEFMKTKIQFVKSITIQLLSYLSFHQHSGNRSVHGSISLDNMYITTNGYLQIQPSMVNSGKTINDDLLDCYGILMSLIGRIIDSKLLYIISLLKSSPDAVTILESIIRMNEPFNEIKIEGPMIIIEDGLLWKAKYSWKQLNDPWSIQNRENSSKYRFYVWGLLNKIKENPNDEKIISEYSKFIKNELESSVIIIKRSSEFFGYMGSKIHIYDP